MKQNILCFFLLTSLLTSPNVNAQDTGTTQRFKTKGGLIGYGKAINNNTDYKVFFLMGDFSWSFKRTVTKPIFLAWYFEPQINPVKTPRPLDIELGANLGLRNYICINPRFYLYQMIGSGPHYISAEVQRQAKGFIFSDNFAVGAFTGLKKKNLFLNLQLRYRHISNAGLKSPNGGIDSWNFLVGVSGFN